MAVHIVLVQKCHCIKIHVLFLCCSVMLRLDTFTVSIFTLILLIHSLPIPFLLLQLCLCLYQPYALKRGWHASVCRVIQGFFFNVSRPLQNINLEPSDLFNLSFGNSFSGSNLFCFFYSNQQTTFPLLHYGNLLVGVPRIILIVQDEE